MPVGRERRYVVANGQVLCHHPYWPEDALSSHQPGWRTELQALNREFRDEIARLTALSTQVARHFTGAWSLDWARTRDKTWYAIDMAPAARSWHWPGCPAVERLTEYASHPLVS